MRARPEVVEHHCHLALDVVLKEPLQTQRPCEAAVATLLTCEPDMQDELPFYLGAARRALGQGPYPLRGNLKQNSILA